jgi:hypothetical protein
VKRHFELLVKRQAGHNEMSSEKGKKAMAESDVDPPVAEEQKEDGKETVVVQDDGKLLQWNDKKRLCEQLMELSPKCEKWGIDLFVNILNTAKQDPEGLDIERLRTDAVAILKDVTKEYLAAAGDGGHTSSSLMIDKTILLVNEERNRTYDHLKSELSQAREAKLLFQETKQGFQDRIAGYKEEIKKLGEAEIAKKLKEMKVTTNKALLDAEASTLALGQCEGDMSALKQHHGDLSRDLEFTQNKLKAATTTLKKYEESGDAEVQLQYILSQVLALREQGDEHHHQLSEQMAQGHQSLDNVIVEQGSRVVETVCSEIVSSHNRMEGIMEDAMGAFHVANQRLNSNKTEEKKERQSQLQADVEVQKKVQRSRLCKQGEILVQRMAHKNMMQEKSEVHRAFQHWGQASALGLQIDMIKGTLNGSIRGSERMKLIAPFSERLVKETGADGVARNVPVFIGDGNHYTLTPPMRKGIVGSALRFRIDEMGNTTYGDMLNLEQEDAEARNVHVRDKHESVGGGSTPLSINKQDRSKEGRTSENPSWTPERPASNQASSFAKKLATVIKQDFQRSSAQKPASKHVWYDSEEEDEDGESVGSGSEDEEDEEEEEETSRERVHECVRNMLDSSACDGQGNEEESGDESEDPGTYDEEMSEHLSTVKDLAMNPRSTLSRSGTARVRVRAFFALEMLTLLHTMHQRELSGKKPLGSALTKAVSMWESVARDGFECEKTDEMRTEVREWKKHASMKNKNKGRKTSMEAYQAESDDY